MTEPNFYAIIPADVRYDKTICANAKLLYGEITALCNQKGFCYASNQYFAELYDVAKGTISGWVSQLVKSGYLRVEIINENQRKIYLVDLVRSIPKKSQGATIKDETPCDKKDTPPTIKAEHINTLNTTINNIEKEEPLAPKEDLNPFEKTNLVETLIDDYLRKRYRTKVQADKRNCKEIADRILDDEDVETFMAELFLRYEASWWNDKMAPQPRQIVKAWDQLMVIDIPDWKRHGYGSEYEYNLKHKTQPSHAITYEELQTYQEPKADPEQINNFLESLETLKT